jgi:hypothetical protein
MALNQWLRRSLIGFAPAFAIAGLFIGSSLSQGDDVVEDRPKDAAKTLTITITADENGKMSSIRVGLAKLFDGPLDAKRLNTIDRRLKDVFSIEGVPFDQVLFRVDDALNSGDLIKVIKVCDKQTTADGKPIKKMSFVSSHEE